MNIYDGFDTAGSLVSEKYDGICAIWDGAELRTRDGNRVNAPEWFTAGLPATELSGELWCGREQFETVLSIVKSSSSGERWRGVRLMVFSSSDPSLQLGPHAEYVTRWLAADVDADRDRVVAAGGEGVVIRDASGVDWKHKPISDDDAVVIGHVEGKGRNAGRCGALAVRDRDGREFRIGSGLTDYERDTPPAVGAIVTFRFSGRTRTGKPRFASYVSTRAEATMDLVAA